MKIALTSSKLNIVGSRSSDTVKVFFSTYRNTNCQVLKLNCGTILKAYIKHVCSSDNSIQTL